MKGKSYSDLLKGQLALLFFLIIIAHISHYKYIEIISFIMGTLFMLFPAFGKNAAIVWYKLGDALGWVNSRIILSLVFFVVLTPIAWLYKLSGKGEINLHNKNRNSNFTDRQHTYTAEDFKDVW